MYKYILYKTERKVSQLNFSYFWRVDYLEQRIKFERELKKQKFARKRIRFVSKLRVSI